MGAAGSVSFAQGSLDEEFAEIASAVQHREKDDLAAADGDHRPIWADEHLARAIDPFSLEFGNDTTRHGKGMVCRLATPCVICP